ncbi:aminoglycoside phosphotransferase family protein [Cryobacterium sp. TMT4-31]|nr:aminoglycoside phosphotransferase family protein [Cryobacterium sp. TMT4-31]
MSGGHDLGPLPARVTVDSELVQRLIATQFPQWSALPVTPVALGGWDNWTFHLGPEMSIRLPSAAEYALAVEKEQHWLPQIAGQLPLPIPTPLGKGRPSEDYPFSWSVYAWLDGETAAADRVADPLRFAEDLADFLEALQQIDPTGGPRPGTHNWFRGGSLRTFDATLRNALSVLEGRIDVGLAEDIWGAALSAPWDRAPAWFHGDIAQGNLLLVDGRLAAVIDFGTCGVGDPSCDLAGAWTLLTSEGRNVFRNQLDIDAPAWARGRGWALWKTLSTYAGTFDQKDDESRGALSALEAIFNEFESSK